MSNLEELTAGILVWNGSSLRAARRELSQRIADLFGVEREFIRIPRDAFGLEDSKGNWWGREGSASHERFLNKYPGEYRLFICNDTAKSFLAHPAIKS